MAAASRNLRARVLAVLLLPAAWSWVVLQERRSLERGVALDTAQIANARALGVQRPERVRLLRVRSGPWPLRGTVGLSARYGIFIRADYWGDRVLVAHELVHTAQYERLGGIRPFLRAYLYEYFAQGYPFGDLETEAAKTAQRLCG